MKWLSTLHRRLGHDKSRPAVNNTGGIEQAESLLKSARNALEEAQQRKTETRKVTAVLARMNGTNHYGESIFQAMMPREKKLQ